MHHFDYRDDALHCEEVPLERIAREVGTPCYVYSRATLERHYRVFHEALGRRPHVVCYSVKANSNLAVLRTLARLGAGADVVSGGELARALRVGIDPSMIVFSGVGKQESEIEAALRARILCLNVESHAELEQVDRVAARLGVRAPIAIRINPDVDPRTHPYIATGLRKSKFGVPASAARDEYRFAAARAHLEVHGIDCHIGSQLTNLEPFRDSIAKVASLARELRAEGAAIRTLDIGGGLGIPYREEDVPPSPAAYGAMIDQALAPFAGLDLTVVCEPGRVIVGNAGVLLARVLLLKQGEVKRFVVVDAAMNDLLRPSLYDAYHEIWPARRGAAPRIVADLVGPICESGDFLARDREMPEPSVGDLLCVMSAGAYGFAMSSNYNTRPRAAEVLVDGARYAVVRSRETIDDCLRGEQVPDWLG
ncbi:MAG: diaminopimelate decarboxylase [Myxococcota bacterium]